MRSKQAKRSTLAAQLETLAQGSWSGAVRVYGAKDSGAIYLSGGRPVHAEYGRVRGEFAYWQLLGMPEPQVELEAERTTEDYTIARPLALVPPAPAALSLSDVLRAQESAQAAAPLAVRGRRWLAALGWQGRAALGLLAALALVALFSGEPEEAELEPADAPAAAATLPQVAAAPAPGAEPSEPAAAAPATGAGPGAPLELSELSAQGGQAPRLLQAPAAAAAAAANLSAQIVIRMQLDAQGQVALASIYAPRPGREAAEQAALQAARGYRFAAAKRDGRPVPVWLALPVRVPAGAPQENTRP